MNLTSIFLHFIVSFVVCMVVFGSLITFKNRFTLESSHTYWYGVLIFSLLVAGAIALLNLGR